MHLWVSVVRYSLDIWEVCTAVKTKLYGGKKASINQSGCI